MKISHFGLKSQINHQTCFLTVARNRLCTFSGRSVPDVWFNLKTSYTLLIYVYLFSVKYPVIHVLRISEEAEKPSTEKNNQQKNAKSTVNLAKPLSLHEPKVPFIYYVSTWRGEGGLSNCNLLKFIYSEKAATFWEFFTLLLTGTTYGKSKVKVHIIWEGHKILRNLHLTGTR